MTTTTLLTVTSTTTDVERQLLTADDSSAPTITVRWQPLAATLIRRRALRSLRLTADDARHLAQLLLRMADEQSPTGHPLAQTDTAAAVPLVFRADGTAEWPHTTTPVPRAAQ